MPVMLFLIQKKNCFCNYFVLSLIILAAAGYLSQLAYLSVPAAAGVVDSSGVPGSPLARSADGLS